MHDGKVLTVQVNCAEVWTQFGSCEMEDCGQEFEGHLVDSRWGPLTTKSEGFEQL